MSSDYDLSSVLAYLDAPEDPYPKVCRVLVDLLYQVKIDSEDKHCVLADVSDVLDNMKPSARSGFVFLNTRNRKARRK